VQSINPWCLTSHTVNSGTVANYSYVYDRYGNRWQQNVTSGSGPQPQLSFNSANNQITASGITYDAAGNVTNDGTHSYTYDAEGNITAVDGGSTATYTYDALNHRVRTVVGSTATEFVFNASGQRVSIWNGTTRARLQGQYYWGGKPVAFYTTANAGTAAAHFQHQDWQGTERMRTTYNGGVEGSYSSLPFGDSQATTGTDADPYHYATLDHDTETDTDHAQFRQYSNSQGRWLRPDPYYGSYDGTNPQSFNRYAYVLNNPLVLIDPSGKDDCSALDNGLEDGQSVPFVGDCSDGGGDSASQDPDGGIYTLYVNAYLVTANVSVDVDGCQAMDGCYTVSSIDETLNGTLDSYAPSNVPSNANDATYPSALPCQVKVQNAVNNALNTNSTFLGPTSGPGMSPDGYRNGAYNFNFFAPGVINPVAGSTNGTGRFPGSGLHIPLPGGSDPTISPWGYNAAAGGSYFTAHFDSANPTDDLVSLLIHFFKDVLFRRAHGC